MKKQILALLALAALLGGCSKSSSTTSEQTTAASAAPAASDAGSGAAGTPVVLPTYPGATKNLGQSTTINVGGVSEKVDYYDTKDAGPKVAAWYQAHLPSDWQSNLGEPGKKIAGTFSSPDDRQMVMVTGADSGDTSIQLSTKLATK